MGHRALQSETLFRPRAILPARVLAKFPGRPLGKVMTKNGNPSKNRQGAWPDDE